MEEDWIKSFTQSQAKVDEVIKFYDQSKWKINGALDSINIYTDGHYKQSSQEIVSNLPCIVKRLIERINKLAMVLTVSSLGFFFCFMMNDVIDGAPMAYQQYAYVIKCEVGLLVLIFIAIGTFCMWNRQAKGNARMLKLSGYGPEQEVLVRLVTVLDTESVADVADAVKQGLWRFAESRNRQNSFKFGMYQGQCIILENDWTLYSLGESETPHGTIQITKLFRIKMKNEKLRDSRAVEEFLAMKNFITFEMSQETKALHDGEGIADSKMVNGRDSSRTQTLTPGDLEAIGGKQLASRNSQKGDNKDLTKQTTGISNKVRFAEENSIDSAHDDDLEADEVARDMNGGFDTARTDAADGQTTDRAMIEPTPTPRRTSGKHERDIEKMEPIDKDDQAPVSEYDRSQSFKQSYIDKSQSQKDDEQKIESPEPLALAVIAEKDKEEK